MVNKYSAADSSILLLTDDIFAQQASLDLKILGYLPVVETALKGWSKLSTYQPVMVIVDRIFTGKSGFDLCRQLRRAGEHIPILMLVEQETVARAAGSGGEYHTRSRPGAVRGE